MKFMLRQREFTKNICGTVASACLVDMKEKHFVGEVWSAISSTLIENENIVTRKLIEVQAAM